MKRHKKIKTSVSNTSIICRALKNIIGKKFGFCVLTNTVNHTDAIMYSRNEQCSSAKSSEIPNQDSNTNITPSNKIMYPDSSFYHHKMDGTCIPSHIYNYTIVSTCIIHPDSSLLTNHKEKMGGTSYGHRQIYR